MRTRGQPYSFICGIAVRYGEDVIILDGCSRKFTIDFPNKQPLNPSMKLIKISTLNYKVSIIQEVNPTCYGVFWSLQNMGEGIHGN